MSKIVYGPPECGKTANADLIAAHFGLDNIIDGYSLDKPLPENTLALTSDPLAIEIAGVVLFEDVMAEITSA